MRLEDTCQTTTGVIHGKTVELADDLGFRDGQQVEVRITVVPIAPLRPSAISLLLVRLLTSGPTKTTKFWPRSPRIVRTRHSGKCQSDLSS